MRLRCVLLIAVGACEQPGGALPHGSGPARTAVDRVACEIESTYGWRSVERVDSRGRPVRRRWEQDGRSHTTTWTWTDDGLRSQARIERRGDGWSEEIEERYELGRIVFRSGDTWRDERWVHDPRGRVVVYDGVVGADGVLLAWTREDGHLTGWDRDCCHGQPEEQDHVQIHWDGDRLAGWSNGNTSFQWTAHDAAGRPTEGEGTYWTPDGSGGRMWWSEAWTWDGQGRPLVFARASDSRQWTRTWTWSEADLVEAVDGQPVRRVAFDAEGRLLAVEELDEGTSTAYLWESDRIRVIEDSDGGRTTFSRGCREQAWFDDVWQAPTLYPTPPQVPGPLQD